MAPTPLVQLKKKNWFLICEDVRFYITSINGPKMETSWHVVVKIRIIYILEFTIYDVGSLVLQRYVVQEKFYLV
jgi:hypothetical protein